MMTVASVSSAVEFRLVMIQILACLGILHPYMRLIYIRLTIHQRSSRAKVLLADLFERISLPVWRVMVIF